MKEKKIIIFTIVFEIFTIQLHKQTMHKTALNCFFVDPVTL